LETYRAISVFCISSSVEPAVSGNIEIPLLNLMVICKSAEAKKAHEEISAEKDYPRFRS